MKIFNSRALKAASDKALASRTAIREAISTSAFPAEGFHPGGYVREEMDARDWGIPTMARHIGGDFEVTKLALELYLYNGPPELGCRMGELAEGFAQAFGTSIELWRNLEAAWVLHPSNSRPTVEDTLTEMAIFHYGTDAQRADQRSRWGGLSDYEIAASIENDAMAIISTAEGLDEVGEQVRRSEATEPVPNPSNPEGEKP